MNPKQFKSKKHFEDHLKSIDEWSNNVIGKVEMLDHDLHLAIEWFCVYMIIAQDSNKPEYITYLENQKKRQYAYNPETIAIKLGFFIALAQSEEMIPAFKSHRARPDLNKIGQYFGFDVKKETSLKKFYYRAWRLIRTPKVYTPTPAEKKHLDYLLQFVKVLPKY